MASRGSDAGSSQGLSQCPCCDYFTLTTPGDWDICPICFWEDDGITIQRPDETSPPNRMTLREGRHNFRQFGACERDMLPHVFPRAARSEFRHVEQTLPERRQLR